MTHMCSIQCVSTFLWSTNRKQNPIPECTCMRTNTTKIYVYVLRKNMHNYGVQYTVIVTWDFTAYTCTHTKCFQMKNIFMSDTVQTYVWQARDIENIGKHWNTPSVLQKSTFVTQCPDHKWGKAVKITWKKGINSK